MNDPLRIDLALARAAGLPTRSANDASTAQLPANATHPTSPDALFSPLALLLARFLPSGGAPAPVPTPEEARLLQAYLQQRVTATLHAAGVVVPATLRVSVESTGTLLLEPSPGPDAVVTPVLHRDGDIARLVDVLRRAMPAMPEADTRALDATAMRAAPPRASSIEAPDLRRAWWAWRANAESTGLERSHLSLSPALYLGVLAALLLGWWLVA